MTARLRILPVPGDTADYLLVLDQAAPVLFPPPVPPVADQIRGCAGLLVFASEVDVE